MLFVFRFLFYPVRRKKKLKFHGLKVDTSVLEYHSAVPKLGYCKLDCSWLSSFYSLHPHPPLPSLSSFPVSINCSPSLLSSDSLILLKIDPFFLKTVFIFSLYHILHLHYPLYSHFHYLGVPIQSHSFPSIGLNSALSSRLSWKTAS